MGEFSLVHWLIIFGILLLFFGPSKLPGLGSSLGKAIRGFKAGLNEDPPSEAQRPDQLTGSNAQTTSAKTTEKEKERG